MNETNADVKGYALGALEVASGEVETNEHNPDGLECCHHVISPLRARITELERELSEHKDEWDRLEMTVEEAHALRAEVERLTKERDEARANYEEEKAIVNRVWKALGIETYEQAKPFAIDEHVAKLRAQLAEREDDRDKAFKNEIAAKCLAEAYKADLEKLNATKPVAVRTNEACICELGAEWQTDGCPIHPLDDAARAQPEEKA